MPLGVEVNHRVSGWSCYFLVVRERRGANLVDKTCSPAGVSSERPRNLIILARCPSPQHSCPLRLLPSLTICCRYSTPVDKNQSNPCE